MCLSYLYVTGSCSTRGLSRPEGVSTWSWANCGAQVAYNGNMITAIWLNTISMFVGRIKSRRIARFCPSGQGLKKVSRQICIAWWINPSYINFCLITWKGYLPIREERDEGDKREGRVGGYFLVSSSNFGSKNPLLRMPNTFSPFVPWNNRRIFPISMIIKFHQDKRR